MHIINLTIECKHATGDNTKIVCMNSDYVVRITANDCGTFMSSPVKKLVVRHDREYYEVKIDSVVEDGQTILQAVLPPLERKDWVELGVCGKEEDRPEVAPTYCSTSARFACDKSVLCGTVVQYKDPKLIEKSILSNGEYRAADEGADGFFKVNVDVPAPASEERTVDLYMASGNQSIAPSDNSKVMSKVTIVKPLDLIPQNIVKGKSIGGVVGSYEKTFTEAEITLDGEYTPPEGFDGFSKVVVNVGNTNFPKRMSIGDTFTHEFQGAPIVTLSTSGVVSFSRTGGTTITFTAIAFGDCLVTVSEYADGDLTGKPAKITYYSITVDIEDIALPVTAATVEEMNEYLERGIAGCVIEYIGPSQDGFVKGALYRIEEVK